MESAEKPFNPDAYWETRLSSRKGLEGVGFAKLGIPFNKWAYKVRKNVFLRLVGEVAKDISVNEVLDIGSGTGFYIPIWEKLGAKKITGSDITGVAVENLKKNFPEHVFYQFDAGGSAIPEEVTKIKYDLISCMDVLFHIVDDGRFENAISNIAGLLRKGGYFVYSDNFLHGFEYRGKDQASRSIEYLYDLFRKNNFEVAKRRPFMYLTNAPIDSKNIFLKIYWFILEQTITRLKFLGWIVGPLLYPVEMLLVNSCSESPTTEIVILKKK